MKKILYVFGLLAICFCFATAAFATDKKAEHKAPATNSTTHVKAKKEGKAEPAKTKHEKKEEGVKEEAGEKK